MGVLLLFFLKETSDTPRITVRGASSQVASSENLASCWGVQERGESSSLKEMIEPGSPDRISLSIKTTLLPSLGYLSPPSSPKSAGASNSRAPPQSYPSFIGDNPPGSAAPRYREGSGLCPLYVC